MSGPTPLEERPWWPKAVALLEQCAREGRSRNAASIIVGERFSVSKSAVNFALNRGSVPAYPASDLARAAAWAAGESRYEGKVCPKHKTRERYSNDGACVLCIEEHSVRFRERKAAE